MPPRAHIVHQLKHRVRLRVPEQRGDPFYFEEAGEKLATLDSLSQYNTNTTTGCIVLHFPDSDWASVEEQLNSMELFELTDTPVTDTPAMQPLLTGIARRDRTVASGSAGRVDLRTIMFLALTVLAIRQAMKGDILGPALPLILSAWSLAEKFGVGSASDADDTAAGGDSSTAG